MKDNDNIITALIISAWINVLLIIYLTNAKDPTNPDLPISQGTIVITAKGDGNEH